MSKVVLISAGVITQSVQSLFESRVCNNKSGTVNRIEATIQKDLKLMCEMEKPRQI